MKLMSKNAEDRYQSAFGLMADLQACLNLLKPNGEITPFSLAQNDHSSRFNIPQKLYGRDDEVNTLMAAFGRAATGRSGLMLVAGDPGIGKSALINEVHKPILERRGYFIAGKYEQFRSDVPYSSVMQAFQRLIRQLLSESEERISFWANQIQKAVGVNGKLITDLIPSMELIIGKQAEVEVLGAEESRNRFEHVFRNFIRVFATAEHPLVFFLDDLQWADNASLLLVKNILTDHNSKHLLMIGAFRDGDVNFTHPLHVVLGDLSKAGVPIDRVSLPVLKIDRISELISDVLMVDRSTAHPLAEVVKEKTNGNPFFINQFLQVLHDENMLEFDSTSGWHWDMARINSMQVTDNVVYLMASKIDLLPPGTKELLQIGACFGNRFELEPLSYVAGTSLKETLDNLLYALNDGLVGLNQEFYEFRHDRIQEAAYSMMTPEKRMSTHQRIGRLALQNTPLEQRNERIFYIVNQLNQGVSLVNDQAEMAQLVALNIAAGRMARSTAAFVQAFHYYEFAMRMLTPDSWSQSYETTLALFNEGAETAYLSGKFAEMEQMSAQVMLKANNILDKVPIYQVRMSTYMAMGDPRSAVNIALEILRFLKIRFPKKPSMFDFVTSVVKSKIFLWGNRKKNLADLPDVTDPYALATLKILAQACSAAYFSMPVLCFLMTIKAFRLSVTYGSTTHTPYIFAQYGGILCAFTDFGTGYKFGKLALGLLPKLRFGEQYAKVKIFVNTYVMHWKEHVRDALPVFKDAHPISLESGDLEFAAFSALMYCYHSFYSGVHLEALERELARYISIVADTKQDPTLNLLKVHHQLILNLLGKAESDYQLIGPSYNENEAKPTSGSELYKLQLRYLLGHFEEALECGNWVGRRKTGIAATFHLPEFRFYDALMRLALCRKVERQRQKKLLQAVDVDLRQLKKFASFSPMNHQHRYFLIEAELARVKGNHGRVMLLYEKSIDLAKENRFVQDEAIACELASTYCMERGMMRIAKTYMQEAYSCYQRWGATVKLKQLQAMHPNWFESSSRKFYVGETMSSTPLVMSSFNIELSALKKSLKIIAEEKVHSKMIEKTIKTAIEFACAQKGVLILKKPSAGKEELALIIEAEGYADRKEISILQSMPIDDSQSICISVVKYAARSQEFVVVHNALMPQEKIPQLESEPYIVDNKVKSILCLPILTGLAHEVDVVGLLYLENNLTLGAFTEQRIEILEIICLAAAGRLELSRKASTDGLTGLYNHDYFQNILQQEILLSRRNHRKLSLLLLDIDYFKKFNDTWGHQAGDLVLKEVANSIRQSCRKSDVVVRYGGEEMAVLLPETGGDGAVELAEKIRTSVEALEVIYSQQTLKVTISIGVACFPLDASAPSSLIGKADSALYEAKHKGRNCVSRSGSSMH